MVLEIRLENFYSIKNEISLNFRAENINTEGTKALSSNVIDYKGQKILKSIGLFGANASGKSNIFKAINFCQSLVVESHQFSEGTIFHFSPFRLDGYLGKPSLFFINFINKDIEFEYSFSLTNTEILKESLYYYPKGRRAKIFDRDENKGKNKKEIYNFANGLIPRPFDVAINTSRKTLFLSRACQMDRELCKDLYEFFLLDFQLGFAPIDFRAIGLNLTESLFKENKAFFLHALSICDSDISDINFIHEKSKLPPLPVIVLPSSSPMYDQTFDTLRFETFHKAAPELSFDLLGEESSGTIQLFSMLFFILNVIKEERIFILDEFDLSLHIKIAEFIIDLFHASSTAQFLFTSHNTNLIDIKRFRRDQILFAQKKDNGSTELYSLFDYKDFRENMDAEKGYLQGRFDAIPIVDNSLTALKGLLESVKAI